MTSRQNDDNKNSLSIAEEILYELGADNPVHSKEEPTTREETALSHAEETSEKEVDAPETHNDILSGIVEDLPKKGTTLPVENRMTDEFSETVISIEPDETEEDSTDEFIIPATESPAPERIETDINSTGNTSTQDTSDSEAKPSKDSAEPQMQETEVVRPHDLALPPTPEEKRNGAINTKIMSPEHDDSDDFIFTKYKKISSHSGKKKSSKKNKKTKTRFRDKPFWKKLLIILTWILGVILGLGIALVVAFKISSCIGKKQLTNYENINITAPAIEGADISISNSGKVQKYNGKEYVLNEDITTILCMGVDKHGLGTEDDVVGTAGQADALYLVAIDTKSGKTDIIAIPRDIVTDIGIYSTSGEYLRTEKTQLCLAYAYGDGFETSCENTKTAVERLFNNLRIQSYFAVDMEAIAYLNDAVGGVTVTMKDDFFHSLNNGIQTRHYRDEVITLYGNNALRYVQQREVAYLESTTERMDRQINYLQTFSAQVIDMTKKDLGLPVDLYNIVSDNSVTDLNINRISYLADLVIDPGIKTPNFTKISGTLTSDGTYAVYEVDTQAFYEQFLDIFFIPQN